MDAKTYIVVETSNTSQCYRFTDLKNLNDTVKMTITCKSRDYGLHQFLYFEFLSFYHKKTYLLSITFFADIETKQEKWIIA